MTCLDVLLGAYRGVSLSCLSRLSQDSEARSLSCCCSRRDRSGGLPEAEREAGRDMRVAASKKLARMPCFPPSTLLHTSRFSVGTLSNALVGWWVGEWALRAESRTRGNGLVDSKHLVNWHNRSKKKKLNHSALRHISASCSFLEARQIDRNGANK